MTPYNLSTGVSELRDNMLGSPLLGWVRPGQMSSQTKHCQRSLAKITTIFNAMFIPGVCPLRQRTMSPSNIAHLNEQDKEVLGLAQGVQLGLVRVGDKFEATYDELDNTHNTLMMWKHFGVQRTKHDCGTNFLFFRN